MATSVGAPDGWWAAWGGDGGATGAHDANVLRAGGGRHSYRLTTPAAGKGLRIWSYPVNAPLLVGRRYTLSLWARGAEAGATVHVGFEALFGAPNVTCPSGRRGQCSYTPRALQPPAREWRRFEWSAAARFEPDKTGWHGAAGMVSIELVSNGTAWVDGVELALAAAG